jgi:hypothetical protein
MHINFILIQIHSSSGSIIMLLDQFPKTLITSQWRSDFRRMGLQVKGEGTLVWHIEDDNGRTHKITIKDSLYVPKAPICLLLPQHWSQSADDKNPNPHGTWCADYHDFLVLKLDQEQYQCTIPWERRTNVARLRSAAGTTKYRMFSATFGIGNKMEDNEHVIFAAPHLIPDDDEDESNQQRIIIDDMQQHIFEPTTQSEQSISQSMTSQQAREENLSDFLTEASPQSTPNVIEDDEGRLAGESSQADLLRIFREDTAPRFAWNFTSEANLGEASEMRWLHIWIHDSETMAHKIGAE